MFATYQLLSSIMGGTESKDETKSVDSNGYVNNNVVIQDPISSNSGEIKILLYVICIIKIIELLIFIYKFHRKNLKRKYTNPNSSGC